MEPGMCGRVARTSSREVLAEEFGIAQFVNVDLCLRYNIAPSQTVEAIIRNGAEKHLGPMRWGFASSASTEPSLAPINARAETVATTSMFQDAFRRQRCLVVADGFYEWRKEGRRKVPYFIRLRSGRPFGFAGVWSYSRTPTGQRIPTCAIVTCAPNEVMRPIHDRMPVIVPATAREEWLDPTDDATALQKLLVPLPSEELEAFEVSTLVNSPQNDSPECMQRVGE
jgi:putative SOS response-associated peptidase YedK